MADSTGDELSKGRGAEPSPPEEEKGRPESPEKPKLPMPPDEIVSKLEDLVKFALEVEKGDLPEGVSFVEVFKQLREIQTSLKLLNEYQKESMQLLADIAEREGIDMSKEKPELSSSDQKVLSRLQSLTATCEAARARIHEEIVQNPEAQKEVMKSVKDSASSEKKRQRRRKQKFRSVGEGGWLPM